MSTFTANLAEANKNAAAVTQFTRVITDAAREFHATSPFGNVDATRVIDRLAGQFRGMALKNPDLYVCTPQSIGRCIHLCAATGLVPGGPLGQVDLIPRRVKGVGLELQFQIGWRGFVALGARTGRRAKPNVVFDGDDFDHEEGLDERLVHRPNTEDPGYWTWKGVRAVYVVVRDPKDRADADFIVLYRAGIEQRRAKAQSQDIWNAWPMEMTLKTGIRFAAQRGVLVLDDVGHYAVEQADQDVIDAAEVSAPTRPSALPVSLPDYDLGSDQPAAPEREPVPVAAPASSQDELERELGGAEPAPPPAAPAPKETKFSPETDAAALLQWFGGADWKTPRDPKAFAGKIGAAKNPERLNLAVQYGVEELGWRWNADGKTLLPPREAGEEG